MKKREIEDYDYDIFCARRWCEEHGTENASVAYLADGKKLPLDKFNLLCQIAEKKYGGTLSYGEGYGGLHLYFFINRDSDTPNQEQDSTHENRPIHPKA